MNATFQMVEWEPPVEAKAPARATPAQDALRARLRDRYIVARFPGLTGGVAGLLEVEQVIKVARLYFDEDKFDHALELLDLAGRHSPAEKAFPLARLEIAFLARDAALFATAAGEFRARHADAVEWAEVARLGALIAPADPLFASAARSDHPHYGPWPDMPNWIHASWDLTSEVLAADFHRALTADAIDPPITAAASRAA